MENAGTTVSLSTDAQNVFGVLNEIGIIRRDREAENMESGGMALSIREIARLLGMDIIDVRDAIAELFGVSKSDDYISVGCERSERSAEVVACLCATLEDVKDNHNRADDGPLCGVNIDLSCINTGGADVNRYYQVSYSSEGIA